MSKKFTKILGGLAAAGAVAAGIFYWYKKHNSEDDFEDEFNEDFENEEFELDEDLKEVSDRGYTTLTPATEAETNEAPSSEEPSPEAPCSEEHSQEEAPAEDTADVSAEEEPKAE